MTFVHILINNVIPLAVLIALGVILQRAFRLDMRTLSKLNFYLFSPAVMFKMLYESDITGSILLKVLLFFCVFFALLFLTAEATVRLRAYSNGMRAAVRNSVIFYNSANYGLPLNQLVFVGNPLTMSVQIIIMMLQSLIPNTYGVYSVNAHQKPLKETLRTIVGLPVIYVIPAAFLLKGLHIAIPTALHIPLNYVAGGFFAIALVTLGVQLGGMKWKINLSDVLLSNVLRLLVGPVLGFLVVLALGIHGMTAKALVLSCAVPTSLSSALLAVEFNNEPEFASQVIFASTVFSMFTVSAVIYLLGFVH